MIHRSELDDAQDVAEEEVCQVHGHTAVLEQDDADGKRHRVERADGGFVLEPGTARDELAADARPAARRSPLR